MPAHPDYLCYIPASSVKLGDIHSNQTQIIDNMPIKGSYLGEEDKYMIAHPAIKTRS